MEDQGGSCGFTWKEGSVSKIKKTCNSCDRPLYDGKDCIFHSEDIEGKKEQFRRVFLKEFDRQQRLEKKFDFTGFVFPEDIEFKNIEFNKDVSFRHAIFKGRANFEDASFTKGSVFSSAQFILKANFKQAYFSSWVGFRKTVFHGGAIFKDATISGNVDFGGAIFHQNVNFEKAEFQSRSFFGQVEFVNINKVNLNGTFLYDSFDLLEYIEKNRKKSKRLIGVKYLPNTFKFIIGDNTQYRNPILSKHIKNDIYLMSFRKKNPCLYFLWWLFADCGRSLLKWALWSLGIAILFALLYWIVIPCFEFTNPKFAGSQVTDFWSYLYFSFVTFTTLGFGDIVGIHWVSKLFVTIEVIAGYVMLGGLISIFANKLSLRN
jgi:uncharacterized protein YjbI with pentapeptide repeats